MRRKFNELGVGRYVMPAMKNFAARLAPSVAKPAPCASSAASQCEPTGLFAAFQKGPVRATRPAIFLHSSFRTSSTWLFECFRARSDVVAYLEIFNEELQTITAERAATLGPSSWFSKHPGDNPYFAEFIPLIKETGGVRGYSKDMAFDRFFPVDGFRGALDSTEIEYIRGLIENSVGLDMLPILSCTRTLGRVYALKREFGGFHILIYRNIFQQWCSYAEQSQRGNKYFFKCIEDVMRLHFKEVYMSSLRRLFRFESFDVNNKDCFICFVLFHLYLYGCVIPVVDLVVDVNMLAVDPMYRRQIEQKIEQNTGLELDLSSVRNNQGNSIVGLGSAQELGVLLHTMYQDTFPSLEASADLFVRQGICDVCAEYQGLLLRTNNKPEETL